MARHMGGWIKLWRKAALGDINSNYARGGLFNALMAMANIQASIVSWRGKPRKLERGEIVTSLKELAELGDVDRSTVLRHLNYLLLRDTISLEKSNRGVLIKIQNYNKYQDDYSEGPHQAPTQAPQQPHFCPTHNEELKNKRKIGAIDPKTSDELFSSLPKELLEKWEKKFDKAWIRAEIDKCFEYYFFGDKKPKSWTRTASGWINRSKNPVLKITGGGERVGTMCGFADV